MFNFLKKRHNTKNLNGIYANIGGLFLNSTPKFRRHFFKTFDFNEDVNHKVLIKLRNAELTENQYQYNFFYDLSYYEKVKLECCIEIGEEISLSIKKLDNDVYVCIKKLEEFLELDCESSSNVFNNFPRYSFAESVKAILLF